MRAALIVDRPPATGRVLGMQDRARESVPLNVRRRWCPCGAVH